MKLALVQEKTGKLSEAIKSYDKIINDFSSSPLNQAAKKNKARLEGLLAE